MRESVKLEDNKGWDKLVSGIERPEALVEES